MNRFISIVSNKYNRLDLNSIIIKNNKGYFKKITSQLDSLKNEKSFRGYISAISLFKVVSKYQKCIHLVEEFYLFIDKIKGKLERVKKSSYKNILLQDIDIYKGKFETVLSKPIFDIYKLFEYLSFKNRRDTKKMLKEIDSYLTLEKEILDYIEIIKDDNTQLESITKNNFMITLNDYYHILTIENHNDTKLNFMSLKKEIEKTIKEELIKIRDMTEKVDKELASLDEIINAKKYVIHPSFRNKIEELQHRLMKLRVAIADSKYVLGNYYLLKNEVFIISKKYDHLKFRSDLLKRTKNDTISILRDQNIFNKSNKDNSESINQIKSIPTKISQKEIDLSFKRCENSKQALII